VEPYGHGFVAVATVASSGTDLHRIRTVPSLQVTTAAVHTAHCAHIACTDMLQQSIDSPVSSAHQCASGRWPSHVGNPGCLAALNRGLPRLLTWGGMWAHGMHCHGESGQGMQHEDAGSCPILHMGQVLPSNMVYHVG
jgi:hypothetical protein